MRNGSTSPSWRSRARPAISNRPPPTIASFAPGRTVYVASLAAILAPWLAAGYVAAPEALAARIADAIDRVGAAAPALDRGVAAKWIEERFAHSLLSLQRTEARWRGRLARSVLGELPYAVRSGGLRVWARSQRPQAEEAPDAVATRAREAGLLIAPASAFETRRGRPPEAFRLSLGACGSPARLRSALETLSACLDPR